MDADAQLDLVLAQVEGGLAGVGHGAGAQGQAHGAGLVVDLGGDAGDFLEGVAALGGSARDLLHEDRSGDATAPRRVEGILDGDVVVDDDRGDGDVLHVGQLGGGLKVEDVARVVLDDVQDTGAVVGGLRGLQDRVGGGRGEDRAGHGRIQHAFADESRVQRLVSGSAAGDEADLALSLGGVTGHEVGRIMDIDEVGVGQGKTFEGFADDGVDVIDELLHNASLHIAHLYLYARSIVPSLSTNSQPWRPPRCGRPGWVPS